MSRFTRILIVFLLVVVTIPVATSLAIEPTIVPPSICPPFATTESGIQASTAQYQICMPPNWNGDLVVFAHGYVDPQRPISMPYDQLTFPDGTNLPALINSMGYA